MTESEARDVAQIAREFMPKSSEAQEHLLADAVEPYGMDDALNAVGEHGKVSEFISVPEILKRIKLKAGNEGAQTRLEQERIAATIRQGQAAKDYTEAQERIGRFTADFADVPDDELEEMKQRAIATLNPDSRAFMQKHNARTTLVLQAVIKRVCA
jgi:hypothetical protein